MRKNNKNMSKGSIKQKNNLYSVKDLETNVIDYYLGKNFIEALEKYYKEMKDEFEQENDFFREGETVEVNKIKENIR